MNISSFRRRAVAGTVAGLLVLAACGGDDDSDTTDAPTEETTAVSTADTGSTDDTDAPDSTDAPSAGGDVDYESLAGDVVGSGATFPKPFYDEAIAEFEELAPDVLIEYGGGGSGKGRTDLQEQLVDFAGTDSTVKDEDRPDYGGGEFVYIPTVVAPITMSYNLPGVDSLNLDPTTLAGIFQLEITSWNDPAIAEDNPDADLPDTAIVVARRADGSGTTDNFTRFLDASVGEGGDGTWTLGSGSEIEWPSGTQAGEGNSGVAQIISETEGAIGYVDLSDANANGLSYAAVENKEGEFVEPTVEATTAAVAGVEIADDLTFFTGWADGADAYPIAAQTWILAYTEQENSEVAEALRGFLTYMLTEGQELAVELDYAPLPDELREQALANVALIGG